MGTHPIFESDFDCLTDKRKTMEWEQSRSRARQIESSLDAKLVSFSKIGTSDSSLELEIDQLMIELESVTENMRAYCDNPMSRASSAAQHTLTRHSDILKDYRNEYRKTKNNISASRAREDLLGSVQRDIDEYKGLRGGKQEM